MGSMKLGGGGNGEVPSLWSLSSSQTLDSLSVSSDSFEDNTEDSPDSSLPESDPSDAAPPAVASSCQLGFGRVTANENKANTVWL